MKCLLVQLTAEFAKVWSLSSRRLITYSQDDIPNDSHEGDWIDIEFESSGVMIGMNKTKDILETRRDKRGKMQVLDVFLIDFNREEAFSETFGVVKIKRRDDEETWIDKRKIIDHCFLLWMTISSRAQFSIEEQSLERGYSKTGKYCEKYRRLEEEFPVVEHPSPKDLRSTFPVVEYQPLKDLRSEEREDFDETILIVGFDKKSNRFFSASRSGEAYINQSVWSTQEDMERGSIFRAKLKRHAFGDTNFIVVKLYGRADPWEGVQINVTTRDVNVELKAMAVEQRKSCYALETEPFGLITYSLDKSYLSGDLNIGDHLRVNIHRYKHDCRADYPSKWQVTKVIEVLQKVESKEWFKEKSIIAKPDTSIEYPDEFREKIVIVGQDVNANLFFSSSRCGEAVIYHNVWQSHGEVKLGDVFQATLRKITDFRVEYEVLRMEKRVTPWEGVDLMLSAHGADVVVELDGEIVERRTTCCALDTTPFGLITYPLGLGFKGIPEDVHIGERFRVRIRRFWSGCKPDCPSKWKVTDIIETTQTTRVNEDWVEAIVTSIIVDITFFSFKHGNALYNKSVDDGFNLSLGTVADICVRSKGSDSTFEVCDIDNRTRTRDDMSVEKCDEGNGTKFTVNCDAVVMDRRGGYFLLDTPIIGMAQLFFKECPKSMRVGDTWRIQMHRRKDKRELESYWVVHAVVGDSPLSTTIENTSRNEGRRRSEETRRTNQLDNDDDDDDDDPEWGTVIITGSYNNDWYASCFLADTIVIPFSLTRGQKTPEKGTFYRIKCSYKNGRWRAYDINLKPIFPEGFKVVLVEDCSLQIWCYARIKSCQSKCFTLYNEILGEATLPRKFALSTMKVGDEIEALYYRVKTSQNATNWMVQRTAIASDRRANREVKRCRNEHEEERSKEDRRDDQSEKSRGSNSQIESVKSSNHQEISREKDCRVLDKMRYFMNIPEIREAFKREKVKELGTIEDILEKDHMRLHNFSNKY